FAVSKLSDAMQYRDYVDNLDTINGNTLNGARTYSLIGTVGAGSKTFTSLDAIGLHLSTDGTVMGNPLVAGLLTFTVRCIDGSGNIAKSRNGLQQDQPVTLNVQGNASISSTVVCTALSVKGDTTSNSRGNKDS